jgi:hypothetical protein
MGLAIDCNRRKSSLLSRLSLFLSNTMLALRTALRPLAHVRPAAYARTAAFSTARVLRSEHHQPIIQGEGAKPGQIPTGADTLFSMLCSPV